MWQIGSKLCPGPASKGHHKFSHSLWYDISFSFRVFAVLNFTQKKQLHFFGSGPNRAHFGGSGGNTSSKERQTELIFWLQVVFIVVQFWFKAFYNLILRQGVPKAWAFDPALTIVYPLKTAQIKSTHQAIQINQNKSPISFQFSMKTIATVCSI